MVEKMVVTKCFPTFSAFFPFSPVVKWALQAAVGVSNLGQASYLGWSNENHQYLDVMLNFFLWFSVPKWCLLLLRVCVYIYIYIYI